MLIDAFAWIRDNPAAVSTALRQHIILSGSALLIAFLIGFPLAIAITRSPTAAAIAINLVNGLRTIPSLAILSAALPVLGIGLIPSLIALVVLALPPIVLNTYIGLKEVAPDLIDAATGMGMTRGQIMRNIQIPLAAPIVFAGGKIAAIQVISGAALASFIGGGGLGDIVTAGTAILDIPQLIAGSLLIVALALLAEGLLGAIQRRFFAKTSMEDSS